MISSPTEVIDRVHLPLNKFKNQIEIIKSNNDSISSETIFPNFVYHKINFTQNEKLIENLKNAEETFYFKKKPIIDNFPNIKFIFTSNKVENIKDINKREIVNNTHDRAHRNTINNIAEAQKLYFRPDLKRDFKIKTKMCEICKFEKYERKPVKQPIGCTPIPTNTGESISMDLFHLDRKIYVTCIDRFSKYLRVFLIENKLNFHNKLEEILKQNFPRCKTLITDNESIFVSASSKAVYNKYNIVQTTTPIQHSTSNGQVERSHSTIIELTRCLAKQNNSTPGDEIYNAVKEYNNTIHSVTDEKPIDINQNPLKYTKIYEKIKQNQEKLLKYHNKNRKFRKFNPGETIYVKTDRRRKNASAYKKYIVKEDRGDTILTTTNKTYHKDSLRKN